MPQLRNFHSSISEFYLTIALSPAGPPPSTPISCACALLFFLIIFSCTCASVSLAYTDAYLHAHSLGRSNCAFIAAKGTMISMQVTGVHAEIIQMHMLSKV